MLVLGLTLVSAILIATAWMILRQGAQASRNFAQRVIASTWTDRINARIAAVIRARPWEERFYMPPRCVQPPYVFCQGVFPFEDLATHPDFTKGGDGSAARVWFEGAIVDVVGERRYRVKLTVTCDGIPFQSFSEGRYPDGAMDQANIGVGQIVVTAAGDTATAADPFEQSRKRVKGVSVAAHQSALISMPTSGRSVALTSACLVPMVSFPRYENIAGLADEFAAIYSSYPWPDPARVIERLQILDFAVRGQLDIVKDHLLAGTPNLASALRQTADAEFPAYSDLAAVLETTGKGNFSSVQMKVLTLLCSWKHPWVCDNRYLYRDGAWRFTLADSLSEAQRILMKELAQGLYCAIIHLDGEGRLTNWFDGESPTSGLSTGPYAHFPAGELLSSTGDLGTDIATLKDPTILGHLNNYISTLARVRPRIAARAAQTCQRFRRQGLRPR